MRRQALPLILAASMAVTMTGCLNLLSLDGGGNPAQGFGDPGNAGCQGNFGRSWGPPKIPGVLQDPWGNNVPVQGMYASNPPGNAGIARQMLASGQDADAIDYYDEKQQRAMNEALVQSGMPPRRIIPDGLAVPKGMSPYPGMPSSQVMQAAYSSGNAGQPNSYAYNGYYPSGYYPYGYSNYYFNPYYRNPGAGGGEVIYAEIRSDGSDSGVRQAQYTQPSGGVPYGAYGATRPGPGPGGYASYYPPNPMMAMPPYCPPGIPGQGQGQRIQIKFTRPNGMNIFWLGMGPDGRPMYSPYPLIVPGRYNFVQGATYRLKINHIEDQPLQEFYPTLEIFCCTPKTQEFLAHTAVPLAFTDVDFKQVKEANYLVKVIYLPDPEFQDQAGSGLEEILSTRLDPGMDPLKEARKRGTPLLVVRMGNVDQNLDPKFSPSLNAGSPYGAAPGYPPPGAPGPVMPNYPPGAPAWGNPGYPPPGFPPGPPPGFPPGCPPGVMPPTFSLGGDRGMPDLRTCPNPQVPYMYWPGGPFANSPWCGPWCPPGYGPGMPPWGPPPYPLPPGAPFGPMPNPGMPGNLPPLGPNAPGPPSQGSFKTDAPRRFDPNSFPPQYKDSMSGLVKPPAGPNDAKTPANGSPGSPTSTFSLSPPPTTIPGSNPTPVPLVPPPPPAGDASKNAAPSATTPAPVGPLGPMDLPAPPNLDGSPAPPAALPAVLPTIGASPSATPSSGGASSASIEPSLGNVAAPPLVSPQGSPAFPERASVPALPSINGASPNNNTNLVPPIPSLK
jgi:hypothetical protein